MNDLFENSTALIHENGPAKVRFEKKNVLREKIMSDKQKTNLIEMQELIDEHQKLEEAFKEREAYLLDMIASKDRLFSIIAHDLKNPFSALLGFTEFISENLKTFSPEKVEMMMSQLHSAAKGAFSLLENMLIWSRSQNGLLKYNPQITDIGNLVNETIIDLYGLVVVKKISVRYHASQTVIAFIDKDMLNAVLRNLLTNAIKFSYSEGIIDIYGCLKNDELQISICDYGIGMSEETKNKICRLNIPITHEGTAHEMGTGFGLLLCFDFVQKHGGNIEIDSQLNKGCKISVIIPQ